MEPDAQLQYRDWSSLSADLSWIYEGPVPELYREARLTPRFLGGWLVRKGMVTLRQDGRTHTAKPGEWLIVRQADGEQKFSAEAEILSVRFVAEWPDGKPFFDDGLSIVLAAREVPALEESARRLLETVKPIAPPTPVDLRVHGVSLRHFIEVKARFWEWFGILHDALADRDIHPTRTSIRDERVRAILHTLDQLPLSSRVREEELARHGGLSIAHFVRLFRDEVGTTPKRYFDDRRREACRRLLAFSETPIKEIAIGLGFLRLSDFSAWFKSRHDLSPRNFREQEQRHSAKPNSV